MTRAFYVVCIFLVSMSLGWADDQISQTAKDILQRHNELRKKHGAPPVKWNSKIAEVAQAWAQTNAAAGRMFHSKGKYGENIYWTSGGMPSGKSVVDAWYNEIQFYDYEKPGFSLKTGHFTQVIWKSSKEIGAGWARSPDGGFFVVCNYDPPGNYKGKFPRNVEPLAKSLDTSVADGEKGGLSKSHSSAFAKATGSAKNKPVKVSARTMSASNQKLLHNALLGALRKLSSDKALAPVPLSLSITARKVILVEVEPESKLVLQAVGVDQKAPVNFEDLKLSDRATLSLLVAYLRGTSKDAQAMAGVYMELLGKMQDASAFYSKAGTESSNKLASLFD